MRSPLHPLCAHNEVQGTVGNHTVPHSHIPQDCAHPGSPTALGTQQIIGCVVNEHLEMFESRRLLGAFSSSIPFPTPCLAHGWIRRSCYLSVPGADMIWSEFPQTGLWELNRSCSSESPASTDLRKDLLSMSLWKRRRAAHLFPHILHQQFKLSRIFTFLVEEGSPECSS